MNAPSLGREDRYLGNLGPKLYMRLGGLGLGLIIVSIVLGFLVKDWDRFWRAYVIAYCFVLSICLGGLFFTMLQHLTRAGWSVVLRRISEGLASNLKWIWIGFIPIVVLVWSGDLYHWAGGAEHLPQAEADLLRGKEPYLTPWFWTARAALYFVIWFALARFFVGTSIAQDTSGDPKLTSRMQSVAAPGMILYAFTQSFAAIDWLMTLEFTWFSTMFGVYFFAASCCGFAATMILLLYFLQRAGRITESVSLEHYQDMGKFLFAFGIVFWSYIAYSQYMLIWYANIPEETTWFLIRQLGSWKGLSILLILGHFLLPFLFLLSRHPKRFKGALAAAAAWMVVIHFIDIYWLGMPSVPVELIQSVQGDYAALVTEFQTAEYAAYDLNWQLFDVTLVLGLAAMMVAGTAFGLRERSLIPEQDPRLAESLAFENY